IKNGGRSLDPNGLPRQPIRVKIMRNNGTNTGLLKKLLRKPAAAVALSIIALTTFIAVFAYLFAPDDTPNANRMVVELGAREPGFSKKLLFIPTGTTQDNGSFLSRMFSGTTSVHTAIPVNQYW